MADCPTLTPYEHSFWRAFGDLATMRQVGAMGAGPIPWDKIITYGKYHDFSRTDITILVRVIRNMDSVFLEATRKQNSPAS